MRFWPLRHTHFRGWLASYPSFLLACHKWLQFGSLRSESDFRLCLPVESTVAFDTFIALIAPTNSGVQMLIMTADVRLKQQSTYWTGETKKIRGKGAGHLRWSIRWLRLTHMRTRRRSIRSIWHMGPRHSIVRRRRLWAWLAEIISWQMAEAKHPNITKLDNSTKELMKPNLQRWKVSRWSTLGHRTKQITYGNQDGQIKRQQQDQMMAEQRLEKEPAGRPEKFVPTVIWFRASRLLIDQRHIVESVHSARRVDSI